MKNINQVVISGNATQDSRTFEGKSKVVVFTLAVNKGKDRDGNDLGADFLDVKVFGKPAEWTTLKKGQSAVVVGSLAKEKYNDEYRTYVKAFTVLPTAKFGEAYDEPPKGDAFEEFQVPEGISAPAEASIPF